MNKTIPMGPGPSYLGLGHMASRPAGVMVPEEWLRAAGWVPVGEEVTLAATEADLRAAGWVPAQLVREYIAAVELHRADGYDPDGEPARVLEATFDALSAAAQRGGAP